MAPNQIEIQKEWHEVWEQMSEDVMQIFNHQLFRYGYEAYFPIINAQQIHHFLEVGAGSGRYGLKFAQDFVDTSFILTDPAISSVEFMSKVAKKLDLKNVSPEQADGTKLQYPDAYFDAVFADAVIQHVLDYEELLSEMYRVLKPGGIMIISAVNRFNPAHSMYKIALKLSHKKYDYSYERCYSAKELKILLQNVGLESIKTEGFFIAYGLLRHKNRHKYVAILGVYINKLVGVIDFYTNRFLSRNFGFEVFVVGYKPKDT